MQMKRYSFEDRMQIFIKRFGTEIKSSRVKYEVELAKKVEKNPKISFKYPNSQQKIRD